MTWDDPLEIVAGAPARSGLQLLRAIADGSLPAAPIAKLLGMDIESLEEGRVVFGLTVGEHQYNPLGSVHGGVISTILDSALGCAIHSTLPVGRGYTTLDLTVNFDRALTVAVPRVLAIGEVVTVGRRVATATGRVVGLDGTLYAHASTTCLVFDLPAAP